MLVYVLLNLHIQLSKYLSLFNIDDSGIRSCIFIFWLLSEVTLYKLETRLCCNWCSKYDITVLFSVVSASDQHQLQVGVLWESVVNHLRSHLAPLTVAMERSLAHRKYAPYNQCLLDYIFFIRMQCHGNRLVPYKRLYQYLWKECPGCELEMSKIIWICVRKKDLGHITTYLGKWYWAYWEIVGK